MLNEEEGRTGGRYESGGAGCVCEKKKEILHFYLGELLKGCSRR